MSNGVAYVPYSDDRVTNADRGIAYGIKRGATIMSSEPQPSGSRKRRLAVRTPGGERMNQQIRG